LRTFQYQDARERGVASGLSPKVLIKEALHPTSVTPGKEFAWHVVGHVEEGSVTNPGVAYAYVDGPASEVVLIGTDGSEDSLPKGYAKIMYYKATKDPCTDIDSRALYRGARFPSAGTYRVWLLSGYLTPEEAAMGSPSLGGLYELTTGRLRPFAAGIPVTLEAAASEVLWALAPALPGVLMLLLSIPGRG
jgi:hypothetical protein